MVTPPSITLTPLQVDRLKAIAATHGFPLSGLVNIDRATEFSTHLKRYDDWLAAGYSGTMAYLVRGRDRRADPRLVFPSAQSVLAVGFPYHSKALGAIDPAEGPRFARYLRQGDYHHDVAKKLDEVLTQFRAEYSDLSLAWKVCVDTSAVLERTWAYFAGLGWIGKNTLLIHPQIGSYFFIGIALINVATDQSSEPMKNYCGSCRRCLEGCPTQALVQEGTLDARRCISYLTLEHKGDAPQKDDPLRAAIGTWVAGCDVCQEVCPFNLKTVRREADETVSSGVALGWERLQQESEIEYRARVRGSSLARVKYPASVRNLTVAFENAPKLRKE